MGASQLFDMLHFSLMEARDDKPIMIFDKPPVFLFMTNWSQSRQEINNGGLDQL
jgi:hypothetical protein